MPTAPFVGPQPSPDRLSVARVDFPGTYLRELIPDRPHPGDLTVGIVSFEVAQDITPMEFEAFLAADEQTWGLCIRSQSRPSSRAKPAPMLLVVDGKLPVWAAARLGAHFWMRRSVQRDQQFCLALAFRALRAVPSMQPGQHEVAVLVAVEGATTATWRVGTVVPLPWRSTDTTCRTTWFDQAQSNRLLLWEAVAGHLVPGGRSEHKASPEIANYILRFEAPPGHLVTPQSFEEALETRLRDAPINGLHVVLDGAMATWMAAWASVRLLETGARVVSVRDANAAVERIVRCDCGHYPSGGVAVVVGRKEFDPSAKDSSAGSTVPFPAAPVGGHVVVLSGDPNVGKTELALALERVLARSVCGRTVRLARRVQLNPDGEGLWARETSEVLRDVARRAQAFSDRAITAWVARAMAACRQFRVVIGDLGGKMGDDTIRAAQLATAVVHLEDGSRGEARWLAGAWKGLAPTAAIPVVRVVKSTGARVEWTATVIVDANGTPPNLVLRVVEPEQNRAQGARRGNEHTSEWTLRLGAFLYGAPLCWFRREGAEHGIGWRIALQRLVEEALPTLLETIPSSAYNTDPALLSALGAVTWNVAHICAWGAGSPPAGAPASVLQACLDLSAASACIGLPADGGYDVARLARQPKHADCPEGLHGAWVHFHESRLTRDHKDRLLRWLEARMRTLGSAEESTS